MAAISDQTQEVVNLLGDIFDDMGLDDILRLMSTYLALRQNLGNYQQSLICMACNRITYSTVKEAEIGTVEGEFTGANGDE